MVDFNKKESSNTKQAVWVAIGSLFSFGFSIVSSMILSRYFDKGDYGTYKQVLYVYNTLLVVFTLGLPKAYSYFLPRVEINQGKDIINKINSLFFVLGGLFSFFLFFFSYEIACFLNNSELEKAIKIFSIVPILMLPTMGLESILATYKKTKFMTLYVVSTRLVQLFCVVLPVIFWNSNYISALVGFDIASIAAFIIALKLKSIPFKDIYENHKSNVTYFQILKFSLPLMFASIWAIISQSADQYFISQYFGKEIFAEFSNGWMELPFIGMITAACATVLSPIFSKLSLENINPRNEIYPIWIRVFEKSVLLIYPLLVYSCFFADAIMIFLYGKQYENSSVYFILKNLSCFFSVIVFAPLIINVGGVVFYNRIQCVTAIILVMIEYIAIKIYLNPYVICGVSTIVSIGRIFLMLSYVSNYFKIKMAELFPLRIIGKIMLSSIFILCGLRYLLINRIENNILLLLLTFMAYIILYLICCFFIKVDYVSIVKSLKK